LSFADLDEAQNGLDEARTVLDEARDDLDEARDDQFNQTKRISFKRN